MKKYELTNKTKQCGKHILHQIRALRNFDTVQAGDIGGWIETEANLSQDGDCWVYDDAYVYDHAYVYGHAHVYGNAHVYDNAWVYDTAQVCGDAHVYGYARVYDNAWIYGNAEVCDYAWVCGYAHVYGHAKVCGGKWSVSPLYIQGTRWPVNMASDTEVQIGCQRHTWEEWHDRYAEIAAEHNGKDIIAEYVAYFNLIYRQYGHEEYMIKEN